MNYEVIPMQAEGSLSYARISTYFLDNSSEINPDGVRPVVLICPGGGYEMTSDRESEAVAMKYLSMGFHAVILRYSVNPAVYPTALLELAKTVAFLREHAEKYHIDKDKIILQGFSAGGHLAASLGVFWKKEFIQKKLSVTEEEIKPNGLILSYPVITSGEFAHEGSFQNLLREKREELGAMLSLEHAVTADTPRTFLWHTFSDDAVPVENSLLFANALVKHKVPLELHIYPEGGHGLGLANEVTQSVTGFGIQKECQEWIDLAGRWIKGLN